MVVVVDVGIVCMVFDRGTEKKDDDESVGPSVLLDGVVVVVVALTVVVVVDVVMHVAHIAGQSFCTSSPITGSVHFPS